MTGDTKGYIGSGVTGAEFEDFDLIVVTRKSRMDVRYIVPRKELLGISPESGSTHLLRSQP